MTTTPVPMKYYYQGGSNPYIAMQGNNTPAGMQELTYDQYIQGLKSFNPLDFASGAGETYSGIQKGQSLYDWYSKNDPTKLNDVSGQPSEYSMWNGAFVKTSDIPALEKSGATVKDGQVVGAPIQYNNPDYKNLAPNVSDQNKSTTTTYTPTNTTDALSALQSGKINADQYNAFIAQNKNVTSPPVSASSILSSGNLQEGSKGAQVSELQSLLGITTDGDFGPKTKAAVRAFQASNGLTVDGIVGPQTAQALEKLKSSYSSTKTNTTTTKKTTIPSTGNSKIDSLISVLNNQSPQKSFTDVYKEVYTSLGLDTLKSNYESVTKEYSDLQNEKNDKAQEINNNPWYSEGVRKQKLAQLDNKYEGKEKILSNKLKLLESNISTGSAEAKFVAGQVMDELQQSSKLTEDLIMKAIDIAEKEATASSKASEKSNTEYSTKSGDTFYSLATKFGTTVEALRVSNPNVDENNLQIGEKLVIPKYSKPSTSIKSERTSD